MVEIRIDISEWNEIVGSNESKIYHLYGWGTVLNEVHSHRLIYLKEGNGIFPLVYIKSLVFGNRLISLPFADYGGPVADCPETIDRLIDSAEAKAEEYGADFIEVRSPCKATHALLKKHGFLDRNDYFTYILPIDRELNELWNSIGNKNRNMIRKAEKNNIKIIKANNKYHLKQFYNIYISTMKKLGSPPQPYKFFELIWDVFFPRNLIMLLAFHDDLCLAGNLYFLHKDIIHHAYNCSLTDYGFGQNNLLQWSAIEWGNENKYRFIDFGRTRANAGNDLFKKKWGGKLVLLPYFYKFYKAVLSERQEIKYKNLSNLWGKYMPESVSKIVGPQIIGQIG